MKLELTGYDLSQFQRCKRPLAISSTHKLRKWRPQSALSACLRHAIFDLSSGKPVEAVSDRAVNYFRTIARNPGLDISGIDVYTFAQDYIAIIRNVLEYMSRMTLLRLHELPNKQITPDISWRFLSHCDDSGALHRWKFVDHLPSDPLIELHSWEVFGDMAAADAPMTLHLIVIGQRKGSHQQSPWCRIYSHPRLAHHYRFQRVTGTNLQGEWKPVYYGADSRNNPKTWVDLMLKDNAAQPLVHHYNIRELASDHIADFYQEVTTEATAMMCMLDSKPDPRTIPKSRYACDHPYQCPHQFFCYTSNTLDNAGIYDRISARTDVESVNMEKQYVNVSE